MIIPGLVSVTFRKLTRMEIASLMIKSELPAIEWGGDVHVPSLGETDEFEYEKAVTEAAYLSSDGRFYIASYGSYYRCDQAFFDCETAISIGAPNVRVWAGTKGSAAADDNYRARIVRNIQNYCDAVKPHNITVSTEFHGGTLTDDYESAVRLINEVERENFYTYWQPHQFRDEEYNVKSLKTLLPYLSNVHVFTWDAHARYPLSDGEVKWRNYIYIIREHGGDHHMLLEFVKDDSIDQFYRDAETLKNWLSQT